MATFKVLLKKQKKKANGQFPLYLRITEKAKPRYISLGISLFENQWDPLKEQVKSHENKGRLNAIITKKKSEAQKISIEQELDGRIVSSESIKNRLKGPKSKSFSNYFKAYLDELQTKEKIGTLDKASAVYRKFEKYSKGVDISFYQIDINYLHKYEEYLRINLKNSVNTIHSNLKIFRMLFNRAVSQDLIDLEKNPFLKYKLRVERTEKVYLTKEELKRIIDLKLKIGSVMDVSRDMFVFACYSGGIRISDMLQLKWGNIEKGYVKIVMQKTKDQLSIKLPNMALDILKKYKSDLTPTKSDYIFPCLSNEKEYNPTSLFKAISSKSASTNKYLKDIARMADIDKRVSVHTSRHTYATLALSLGFQMAQVSKLLGHKNLKVTQHYAKLINKDLDKAMEAFNDLV